MCDGTLHVCYAAAWLRHHTLGTIAVLLIVLPALLLSLLPTRTQSCPLLASS